MQVYRGMDIGTGKATKRESGSLPAPICSNLVDPASRSTPRLGPRGPAQSSMTFHGRGRYFPSSWAAQGLYFRALRVGFSMRRRPDPHDTGTPIRPRAPPSASQPFATSDCGGSILRPRRRFFPRRSGSHQAAPLRCTSRPEIPISELRRRAVGQPLPGRLFVVVHRLLPRHSCACLIHSRVERMMAAASLRRGRGSAPGGFGHTRALAGLGYKQLGQQSRRPSDSARSRGSDQDRHLRLRPAPAHLVPARNQLICGPRRLPILDSPRARLLSPALTPFVAPLCALSSHLCVLSRGGFDEPTFLFT